MERIVREAMTENPLAIDPSESVVKARRSCAKRISANALVTAREFKESGDEVVLRSTAREHSGFASSSIPATSTTPPSQRYETSSPARAATALPHTA